MYRWLLCWRYLRSRYIALASVISVMLGVATLIIVNSVMDGFTAEMQDRMHGILSDIIIESHSANGIEDHESIQKRVRQIVGKDLVGITTVVHVPAMVSINHRNETITRQINLIGIDTDTYADVSDFRKYLLHPNNQSQLSFALRESGYAPDRENFPESGWGYRRKMAETKQRILELQQQVKAEREKLRNAVDRVSVGPQLPPEESTASDASPAAPAEEFDWNSMAQGPSVKAAATRPEDEAIKFDAQTMQHDGIVLGIAIGSTRYRNRFGEVDDYYYVQPGDDVRVTFPNAGTQPKAINQAFTVVDFYESRMSEYDSTFAFVPLDKLQKYRGMEGAVSSIQLKLAAGADLDVARDALRDFYNNDLGNAPLLQINTWRDMQGALLAAVQMETTILNILLFLIIAVAGFGILATFFMIVVEKTKDIGIMKSLGASGTGVASIFLGYGVLLGAFGAGVGAIAGLIFVANINEIAGLLELVTGREVFDPTVYYFDSIPTIVRPAMVVWVTIGAILIAVMASVLPSLRAARMHPVRALRYE